MSAPIKTHVVPCEGMQVFECQTATVAIFGASSQPTQPVTRTAIYIPALGRTFEIGRLIKKSIYGQVVGGSELQLDEQPPVPTEAPAFRRLPVDVAIKIYQKRLLQNPQVAAERPYDELATMMTLSEAQGDGAAHLMPLVACCADETNLYAVMPYVQSIELFDHVADHGAYQRTDDIRSFMRQMVAALRAMRRVGVAHRDMSLENTLYVPPPPAPSAPLAASAGADEARYVVIDFGMAQRVNLAVVADAALQQTARFAVFHPGICGKRGYMAPEVIANPPPAPALVAANRAFYEARENFWLDLFQADVWALGVMLFMLCTGMPPFETATPTDQRFRFIAAGKLGDLLRHWRIQLDAQLQDLLLRMLVADPLRRLTVEEVAAHPFLAP